MKKGVESIHITKCTIADSFISLMNKYDYYKITVNMIVDHAGISRGTFYNYFENKEELLDWILVRDIEDFVLPCIKKGFNRQALLMLFTCLKSKKSFYQRAVNVRSDFYISPMLVKGCLYLSSDMSSTFYDKCQTDTPTIIYGAGLAAVINFWIKDGMKIPEGKMADDVYTATVLPLLKSDSDFNQTEDEE
ncbi:MAG: TetR family transcriptional regulator [Clostridia bacterium]|nr:TetR family transcriptional regulator [Clostridia bacterium]MDD4798934.1 TetR family transcriptional regulator [Clostridia bacterium]